MVCQGQFGPVRHENFGDKPIWTFGSGNIKSTLLFVNDGFRLRARLGSLNFEVGLLFAFFASDDCTWLMTGMWTEWVLHIRQSLFWLIRVVMFVHCPAVAEAFHPVVNPGVPLMLGRRHILRAKMTGKGQANNLHVLIRP